MDDLNDLQPDEQAIIDPPSPFRSMFSGMTSDMRFVGIFQIIYGALNCLSIIGAAIGIPMIFIGLRMREAADEFDMFKTSNDSKALRRGFELQAKFFKIQKILIIVGLVIMALSIILFIFVIGTGFFSMMNSMG